MSMEGFKQLRVLVVDDDALISNVIQDELESGGHVVIGRAADGRQAVKMAEELKPDAILMDVEMPEMDGIQATRQIQAKCPCPVVLLTAYDDQTLVSLASQAGAGAYLVKPPDAAALSRTLAIAVARFADLMELRRLNAELQKALSEIKTLRGILPICAWCRKVRGDKGYWQQVEAYVHEHTDTEFSHSICPDCMGLHFPELAGKVKDDPPTATH